MTNSQAVIEKKVLQHLRRVVGHKTPIEMDTSLDSLGVDSISSMQLVMDLERDMNVHIPDEKIGQLTTPRAVIELVMALSEVHVA